MDIKLVKKFVQLYPQTTIYVDNHADYINSARNWLSLNILHRIIWRHFAKSIEPYTKKFWGVTPLRSLFLKEIYKIDKRKIDTLVMGVDIDSSEFDRKLEIRGEIRRSLGLNETNKVIINGGKLDVLKGTLILLESFIKITDPSYRLLLFGSISNEIANEISYFLKKDKRIIYLGWIEAKSIYKFLYASDVAVYPGTHSVLWEQTIGLGIPTIIKKWNGFEHLEINDSVRVLKKITVDLVLSCIIDFFENLEYFKKLGLENVNVFSYREIAKKSIEINKL